MYLVISILTSACAGNSNSNSNSISTLNVEEQTMTATIYYKPVFASNKNCSSNLLKDIKDSEDKTLVTLCEKDYRSCLMQGSCLTKIDGKAISINYVGKVKGTYRFSVTDIKKCPFGLGVRDSCLDPFFSVAADPKFYKFGDVIYVPSLVGVELPDGQLHDGYLIVRDTGGGIEGLNRFDFFTGYLNHLNKSNPFAKLGLGDPKTKLKYSKVTSEKASEVRFNRNFPLLTAKVLEIGKAILEN